jgi:hypothetical protein
MPSASASEFIVDAVPMVLQWPGDGADEAHLDEFLGVDFARGQQFARLPDDGAGAGALAAEPAVQHRPAGEHDGRDVDGRRRHQLRRGGLVAAGGEHDAVDEIAVQDFHQPEVAEVAVERGGRTLAGFLDRMHGKLEGNPAGFANALAHAMGEFEMMAVAGREVRARLGNADDRPAGLQLLAREAPVHVALEIERRHVGIVRIGEPLAGPQPCGVFPEFACHAPLLLGDALASRASAVLVLPSAPEWSINALLCCDYFRSARRSRQ